MRVDADNPTHVQDLGITVGPGPVWIDTEDFKRSTCLQALIRLGKVRVSSSPRCRMPKDPPKPKIHTVAMSRPSKVPRGHVTHHKTEVIKHGIDPEQAQEMVSKAAAAAAAQAVAAMTAQFKAMMERPASPASGMDGIEQVVEQAVVQALKAVQIGDHARVPSAGRGISAGRDIVVNGPEDPLFIPTGIVRDDSESLTVHSASSGDAGGLDDAASALKALRKKKS